MRLGSCTVPNETRNVFSVKLTVKGVEVERTRFGVRSVCLSVEVMKSRLGQRRSSVGMQLVRHPTAHSLLTVHSSHLDGSTRTSDWDRKNV